MKNFKLLFSLLAILIGSRAALAQQVLPFTSEDGVLQITEDDDHKVFIYGNGSAESLELEELTTAGSVNANILFNDYFTGGFVLNYGTSPVKREKADSVPLSVLYFPDVSNVAFAGSLDCKFSDDSGNNWLLIAGEASIQRRNIEKDSLIYDFGIVNFNVGPKYRWIYTNSQHTAIFTGGIFYNYVAVNRNNSDAFNTLFNDYNGAPATPVKRYFHGLSFLASLQLDNAILFLRTYTDFNQRSDLAFTVGIKASAKLFSF